MTSYRVCSTVFTSLLVTITACEGVENDDSSGSGGTVAVGGSTGLGTTSIQGGSTTNLSGMTTIVGDPTGAGGVVAAGGSTVGAAGNAATGSVPTTNVTAVGGTTTMGGSGSTGGSKAMGGYVSTGGTTSNGGSGSTGGSSSGSCQESMCGSHKWACWKMPNPVSERLANPQSYTDLGNGAVRDNVTCLVWEKANPSTNGTLQASINRCLALATSNYAGFSDWRMPTRVEMASITDVTLGSKGFPTVFTVTSGYYMTGSDWYKTILTDNDATSGNETNQVWGYGANGFTSNAIVRTGTNLVARCVRGNGAGEAQGQYAIEPPNHYTVTGSGADAVVKDNYTSLVWQQTYSSTRMAWSAAAAYCASQTTGGLTGWRVPTLNELASTVNEALVAPAINRTVFPNTNKSCDPDGWYWAAEASKVGGEAWALSYCDGYTGWNAATDSTKWNYFVDGWVRCVR